MNEKTNMERLKRENPFRVPDHYFDSVSSRVADRIHQPEPVLPWYRVATVTAKPYFALAVMFIGIYAGIHFYLHDPIGPPKPDIQTAQNDQTDQILQHLMNNTDAIDLMTFDMASSDPIESGATNTASNQDSDDIINYLMQEGIEITAIADVL